MKAHVAITQKGRMRNELVCDYTLSTEYFCSPIAKAIKGNIFIRQYRYVNEKFPKSMLISKTGKIIWEDTKIHRKYQYDTSNITMDNKFLFCTILNELYVLVEATFDGKIINVVNLEKFGIKKAYYIEKTENETYLVTSIVDKKIVEINKNSESIFEYCPGEKTMCEPRYVCISKKGNYIISDSKRHYIFEVNKAKKVRQVFGKKNNPGYEKCQLMYPYMAKNLWNGNLIFCEHQKNRIVELDCKSNIIWQFGNNSIDECKSPRKNFLNGPTYCDYISENEIIVSDSMNGRILLIDKKNNSSKVIFGQKKAADCYLLNFPRSIQCLDNGNFLVADSRNNRIVEFDLEGNKYFEFGNEKNSEIGALKWPRCAFKDEVNNIYFISDGYNQRLVIMDMQRKIINEITEVKDINEKIKLFDPHSIVPVDDKKMLITDSELGMVCIIDYRGNIIWKYTDSTNNLADPHYACIKDEKVYIADTNNNRIIVYDWVRNKIVNIISEIIEKDGSITYLKKPKWLDVISDKRMAILDSKNNSLILIRLIEKNKYIVESRSEPVLFNSRWACRNGMTFFISDFWRHCIVKYEMEI